MLRHGVPFMHKTTETRLGPRFYLRGAYGNLANCVVAHLVLVTILGRVCYKYVGPSDELITNYWRTQCECILITENMLACILVSRNVLAVLGGTMITSHCVYVVISWLLMPVSNFYYATICRSPICKQYVHPD